MQRDSTPKLRSRRSTTWLFAIAAIAVTLLFSLTIGMQEIVRAQTVPAVPTIALPDDLDPDYDPSTDLTGPFSFTVESGQAANLCINVETPETVPVGEGNLVEGHITVSNCAGKAGSIAGNEQVSANLAMTLSKVVVFAEVPTYTTFVAAGSGLSLTVGSAAPSASPIDTTWQHPDGSGTCLTGTPTGQVCAMRLGDLAAGDVVPLIFNMALTRDAVPGKTVDLLGQADGADKPNNHFLRVVDQDITNMFLQPTSIDDVPQQPHGELPYRIFVPMLVR